MTVSETAPRFRTQSVNLPVEVYKGPAAIVTAAGQFSAEVLVIDFRWLPSTGLYISASVDAPGPIQVSPTDVFRLPDQTEFSISMTRMQGGAFLPTSSVEGWILGHVEGGSGPVKEIRFEIPNLPAFRGEAIQSPDQRTGWFGRKVLEAGPWRILIDSIRDHNQLREQLRASGGFALLDTCSITRIDGAEFQPDEATETLEALRLFLSFISGHWTAPLLLIGIDAGGGSAWYRWTSPTLGRWRGHLGCLPEFVVDGGKVRLPAFPAAWGQFLHLWSDPDAHEALVWAISWYVEANSVTSAELTLTLAQAGLEVLAWYQMAVLGGMRRKEFENNVQAVSKIRNLLASMNVRLELPNGTGLGDLLAFANSTNPRLDGPEAFTRVRNSTIHPRAGTGRVDAAVRIDASRLGLSYVELGILHLLSYRDQYLDKTFAMKPKTVPWG